MTSLRPLLFLLLTLGALVPSCLKSFEKVAREGGAGGSGGATTGGAGGMPPDCADPTPGECPAASAVFVPIQSTGTVEITDLEYLGLNLVLVGRFTGLATIANGGPQIQATGTDGFLLEIDLAGAYVAHAIIPEVDAGSRFFVEEHESGELVIGGSFTSDESSCTGNQGLFVRRLARAGATYTEVFATCETVVPGTEFEVSDVAVSGLGYTAVAGWVSGSLGGLSSEGVDGFVANFEPMGAFDQAYLVGGEGDAIIARIVENPAASNQWLLAGDFDGQITMTVPMLAPQERMALGDRDLFIATYDAFDQDPNLDLVTLGGTGAEHHMVDLTTLPTGRAALIAQMQGPISVPGVDVGAPASSAALVVEFDIPTATTPGVSFSHRDHFVLQGTSLVARGLQGRGNRYVVAGQAESDVIISRFDDASFGSVPSTSCVLDTFFIDLDPVSGSFTDQRCGDGSERLSALGAGAADDYWTAMNLTDATTITVDGTQRSGPAALLFSTTPP